jgi:hypothetical protein
MASTPSEGKLEASADRRLQVGILGQALHHGGKEDTEVLLHMLHDEITSRVLTAAMKVHTALGAGCLESTYDACLRYQLTKDGIVFEHQTASRHLRRRAG